MHMKKMMALAATLAVASSLFADTQYVNGYKWSYYINGETAVIYGSYDGSYTPAISPNPTGTVTVPSTLGGKSAISIGTGAFYNCTGLANIKIPTNVISISSSAFSGCSGLESMTVPFVGANRGGSGTKYDVFGYIFGTTKYTGGSCVKQYYSSCGSVSYCIPSSLKSVTITDETVIGYGAFNDCSDLTSVTLSSNVTNIKEYAFWGCNGLKSVTIPNKVTDIKDWTFAGCGLTSVTIPNGVRNIGCSAFYNCSGLKRISIPSSVVNIDDWAFSDCYELTSVTIPNGVLNIGEHAFYNCRALVSVSISDSVTKIGRDAFSSCNTDLYTTTPSGIRLVDGWAVGIANTYSETLDFTGVRGITSYAFSRGFALAFSTVTIPNSVKSIGESAFYGCTSMKTLTMEAGVKSIGSSAFSGCTGLKSVTIPNSVTGIGGSAFFGCSGLTSVTISDSVTSIGSYAFSECSGLTSVTIPDSVTTIGSYAFSECSGLRSMTIPNSVKSIEPFLFYNCKGMTSVVMPSGVTNIGANAFYNCSRLNDMTIGDVVTNIGNNAFYNCSSLRNLTMGDAVTNIGDNAFYGCSGLRNVTIPQYVCTSSLSSVFPDAYKLIEYMIISDSATIIQNEAFRDCSGLTNVTIGNSMTNIGCQAFLGCNRLASITIPSSVTAIGSSAFSGCTNLKSIAIDNMASWCRISFAEASANPLYYAHNLYLNDELVTELVVPDSVTSISSYAFYGCTNVVNVTIPSSIVSIGTNAFSGNDRLMSIAVASDNAYYKSADGLLLSKDGTTLIQGVNGTVTIPTGVTSIGYSAFLGCSGLTNVILPNSVTNIASDAFGGCSRLTDLTVPQCVCSSRLSSFFPSAYMSIVKVIIADGVTSIGDSVFYGCSKLTSVTIPDSVTRIENSAFSGCSGLRSVTIPQYVCTRGMSNAFPSAYESITDVIVSDGVTDIGHETFRECNSLTHVTIGKSVMSIGANAFFCCGGLRSITVADDNAKYSSAHGLLLSKDGKTLIRGVNGTVTIPIGVTNIDYNAFSKCSGLTSIDIPSSVTSIGDYAFSDCIGLTNVTIPNSVLDIGWFAFCNCSGLESITIPDSVTSIGYGVFFSCNNLTTLMIPNSVTTIGDEAFSGCSGLMNLTIPNSVKSIGRGAFSGCCSLTNFTIPDSVTSIGDGAFFGCNELRCFVVDDNNPKYCASNNLLMTKDGKTIVAGANGDVTIPDAVTSIGMYAFLGCSGLTTVTIPNSVTNIGLGAFRNCCGLRNVTIPSSVTSIGSDAFSGCSGLTTVTIPNSVKNIMYGAFSGCSGLLSVNIPNSVTGIGDYAFSGCSSLANLIMPNSVASIGYQAFSECSGLMSVTISQSICSSQLSYVFPDAYQSITSVVVADGVTNITANAFSGCRGLTTVSIPSSVTRIGSSAFSGCSGLRNVTIPQCVCSSLMSSVFPDAYQCITDVTIADGVTNIGVSAFSGCSKLMNVSIPDSVTNIGRSAFRGCSGLADKDGFVIVKNVLYDFFGDSGSVIIPDDVTSIGIYAFYKHIGLMSVTIPEGVTNIGVAAFRECTTLESVTISRSVTSIDEYAFDTCWNLTNVTFRGDAPTVGGSWAFHIVPDSCIAHVPRTANGWPMEGTKWNGLTIAYYDDDVITGTLAVPVISSADVSNGGTVESGSATISIIAEQGAKIHYTTDGSTPTAQSPLYTAPFVVDGMSVTIKAIAVRDNYFDSAIATFTFTCKPYSLAECIGLEGVEVITDGVAGWSRVLGSEAHDGVAALKSGATGDSQTNWVQITVSGSGLLSFWWKVSCEGTNSGNRCDGCTFMLDGEEIKYADGTTNDWSQVSFEVSGVGEHTLKWAYGKNDNGTYEGADCAWLDQVTWTPNNVIPEPDEPNSTIVTISGVTVHHRFPWDGKVEISYAVTGDIGDEVLHQTMLPTLKVSAIDIIANTTNVATQLSGDLSLEEGTHTIVWDMDAEGVSFKSSNVVFKVSCETAPATYCVIDLSGGASASSYPVSYLSSPPSGGFNVDAYKTSKLVLKRLEAGSFKMGGSYDVTLTKPFFCGLFEMTQKQYSLVTGSNPSNFSGDKRPVEKVSYNVIRGQSNGAKWPSSSAVDSSSFMGKLRARTGLDIDLPTEAQWEYACRAGTTMTYSYGNSADENYMWCSANSDSKTHDVGTRLPNPWGLYDMHGNVRELCLDWYNSSLTGGVVDPKGASSGSNRVRRGGSWYDDAGGCTSSFRRDFAPSKANDSIGFRLVWNQPNTESSSSSVLCFGESKVEHFAHTATTPEPVPYSYFNENCPTLFAECGGDYEATANATAANGHNKVWECYVAGISPTNETAQFTAKIELKDGVPVVTWEPDLNTNGVIRTYKVYGSETLNNGGEWQYPTNSLHRFFKVKVEMP